MQRLNELRQKKIIDFLKIFFIFLLTLSFLRFTQIGRALDDITIRFLFGWMRWLIYPLIIFLLILLSLKKGLKKIKKKKILKTLWLFTTLAWTFGFISILIIVFKINKAEGWLDYQTYTLDKNIWIYIEKWKENSVFEKPGNFFSFLPIEGYGGAVDGGGILGFIVASVLNYLYVIPGFLLLVANWSLMLIYLIYDHPFFVFFSNEKKTKFQWRRMKKIRDPVQIMNQIQDQDITMELPTSQKIIMEEKKRLNETSEKIRELKSEDTSIQEEPIQKVSWDVEEEKNSSFEGFDEASTLEETPDPVQDAVEDLIEDKPKEEIRTDLPRPSIFTDETQNKEAKEIRRKNWEISEKNKVIIENVFAELRIAARIDNIIIGPNATKYEVVLGEGAQVDQIIRNKLQLQLKLGESYIRIEAPIQGKAAVGVEINNRFLASVYWGEVLSKLTAESDQLKLAIGKKVNNEIAIMNLEKLPHLLIAGSTGGGKSVCISAIIVSLIYQKSPKDLRLLLIDPKQVELSFFEKIPHLVGPVITDMSLVPYAFSLVIKEIQDRFKTFKNNGVKNIQRFNKAVGKDKRIPYLVVVIDEFADLILEYRKKIETQIVKMSQIGRAAGVFLVVATQRPSTEIITGLIKNNIPGRIAFRVPNYFDSRTILGANGAELLAGKGDLLYKQPEQKGLERARGVWISEKNIYEISDFWEKKVEQDYWKAFANLEEDMKKERLDKVWNEEEIKEDEMYETISQWARKQTYVSVSQVQRFFNIGYNRSAKICERLEYKGILDSSIGGRPRKVIKKESS